MQLALNTKAATSLAAMAIAAAFALAISGAPASAMGSSDDGAQKPATTTGTDKPEAKPADDAAVAAKCKTGQVWDPEAKTLFGKGKCVDAASITKPRTEKQGMIYEYGRKLAKAGEFERAIEALALAPDQTDPRVLNYLGYSSRKLGRMDEALDYYHAAIAQNPDFSLVREYLGEAYLQLGELEHARGQLSEIERICGGRACGEYIELARLIVESQTTE